MKKLIIVIIFIFFLISCKNAKDAHFSASSNALSGGNVATNRDISVVEKATMNKSLDNFVETEVSEDLKLDQEKNPTTIATDEKYGEIIENEFVAVKEQNFSTFSIDVDTGSYTNIRRMINMGNFIPKDSVRVEEMINYFSYDYEGPKKDSKEPFSVHTELFPSIWGKDRAILKIGIQGKRDNFEKLPPANLVFLVDVSGSMSDENKLPLLKKSLIMLSNQLRENDFVTIVVYAGSSGVVLEPTSGKDKKKIEEALERLEAGGSTYGEGGIRLAYKKAKENFNKEGINRVIICTDGDFNVGESNTNKLKELIEKERESGVTLTTLGFGMGNYNDNLMEQLSNVGNGNYAYIDNINEAKKTLVTQLASTLNIIAKDVKIQIEFNGDVVSYYRQIGYENRKLKKEDFNNDKVDAGEIGSGHQVTAIYEIVFADSKNQPVDQERYSKKEDIKGDVDEFAFLKLRYKEPTGDVSKLVTTPLKKSAMISSEKISTDSKFAVAVASFGQLLRGGKYNGALKKEDIINLATEGKGHDEFGYRAEFIKLLGEHK